MPSMDNWDDLGYYIKYLVDTKSPGIKQRIILEIFKDDNVDHSEYSIVWDIPLELHESLIRLLDSKYLRMQPDRKFRAMISIQQYIEKLLEKEKVRYNKRRAI